MTRATNVEAWQASFGVETDDANDYLARGCLEIALEENFIMAQYANGFKQ